MSPSDESSSARPRLSIALTLGLVGLLLVMGSVVFVFRARAQEALAAQSAVPSRATDTLEQPIAFSHRVHTTANAIPCQLCHTYARRGPVAGIPSVQRCVQCHLTITPDAPEIARLMAFWEAREPIAWLRVHDLPDYVRFTHKRHVAAGVACETCHGDVARMDAAVQTAPLTMGWCVSCHQERSASIDCLTCHY